MCAHIKMSTQPHTENLLYRWLIVILVRAAGIISCYFSALLSVNTAPYDFLVLRWFRSTMLVLPKCSEPFFQTVAPSLRSAPHTANPLQQDFRATLAVGSTDNCFSNSRSTSSTVSEVEANGLQRGGIMLTVPSVAATMLGFAHSSRILALLMDLPSNVYASLPKTILLCSSYKGISGADNNIAEL